LSGKTQVDKDLLKRRESGRAKGDAQFFRIRGGMPLGPVFADIHLQQNTLYPICSELKSTKRWVIQHEIWSGIRKHPYNISLYSLYKISKKIADVIRTNKPTRFFFKFT
jgi:hypothetical protein